MLILIDQSLDVEWVHNTSDFYVLTYGHNVAARDDWTEELLASTISHCI